MKPIISAGLFAVFLTIPPAVAAPPQVSAINGIVEHAETIEVVGSGFGQKSPAAPYLWAPLTENINPSPLGIVQNWSSIRSSVFLAPGEGINGSGALKGAANDVPIASIDSSSHGFSWSDPGQKMYLFRKQKYNFYVHDEDGRQKINWKDFRVWGDPDPSGRTSAYNFYNAPSNSVLGVEYSLESQSRLFPGSGGRAAWAYNEFKTNEIRMRSNTNAVGSGNGVWEYKVDGSVKGQIPYSAYDGTRYLKLWDSDTAPNLTRIFPIHAVKANYTHPPEDYAWFLNVYLDTTWARVMIGNASTLDDSTHLEIQIPIGWSSNSITVHLNMDSFPDDAVPYLFVVDGDNNASQGFPLRGKFPLPPSDVVAE